MEANQAKFEGWAVIELFGHQREVGFVTTQYFGNAAMFQLDVPELPEREYTTERAEWVENTLAPVGSKLKREAVPARSRLINPSAVYAMNPCTEEAARKAIENLGQRKIAVITLSEAKQLPDADEEAYADPFKDEEEELETP